MIKTKSVNNILEILETTGICTAQQVAKLVYYEHKNSLNYAQKKLKQMYDNGFVKRTTSTMSNEYCYTLKKLKQIEHRLLISQFHTDLRLYIGKDNILHFAAEDNTLECLRPDAVACINTNNRKLYICLEIHRSTNVKFDIDKYIHALENKEYVKITNNENTFPLVLVATDTPEKVKEQLKDISLGFEMLIIKKFDEFTKWLETSAAQDIGLQNTVIKRKFGRFSNTNNVSGGMCV
jgi:predicted transcriptional regulator